MSSWVSLIVSSLTCFAAGIIWGIKGIYPIHQLARLKARFAGRGPERTGLRHMVGDPSAPKHFDLRILAVGQSHAAAYGQDWVTAEGAYDLALPDGAIVPLRDPIMNTPGKGGSVWTRLARRIHEKERMVPLFCSVAVAGCTAEKFAPRGDLHRRLIFARKALPEPPTHILLWIGERDAELGTSPESFHLALCAIIETFRSFGWTAPIYVARSTFRHGVVSDSLRAVQTGLVQHCDGVALGPDTDILGLAYRYDGIHFTSDGLSAAANLWYDHIFGTESNCPNHSYK